MENKEITEDMVNLVIARLKAIPSDARLSIGNNEALGTEDLIEEVRKQSDIGKKIIEAQLFYLRTMSELPVEA